MLSIRSLRKYAIVPTLIGLSLAVVACNKTGTTSEHPPEAGDIAVARVNGLTVWTSDVRNEAVAQGQIGPGEPLDPTSDLFSRTLNEVIDQRLLAAAAQNKGLDKNLSAQRRLQAAHDRILGDLLVESSVDRNIDDKAVKAQYDEQVRLSKQSEEIRTRLIMSRSKADADAIMKQLQGGSVFEALAMEKSIDATTRYAGGDMGYFTTDIMPQVYKGVLTTAKAGDTVGPVQTETGWAVLRVEDRRPEQMPTLEEERPVIMRYLIYNQVAGMLDNLRKHADVKILIAPPKGGGTVEPAAAPQGVSQGGDASDATAAESSGTLSAAASSSESSSSKSATKVKPSPLLPGKDPTAGHHFFAPAAAPGKGK